MPFKEIENKGVPQPKPKPRRSSFFQAVTFTGAGTIVNIVFLFVEIMIIARKLDTNSYGIYALLIVIVNFLILAIDFGNTTTVTQLIASSEDTRQAEISNSSILFRLLTIAAVSIILLLGQNLLNIFDSSGSLVTYTIYIPFMLLTAGLDTLLLAILQGKQLYRQMAAAQIIRSFFRLGLTTLFFYAFNLGFLSPVFSWIISFGISVTYEYLVLPFSRRLLINWQLMREMLRFGLPLQLNNFLWFASGSSQSLLLSIFIGPAAVAFYDVAMRIPNAITRLSQAYTAVYFPTATALMAEGKRLQARRLLERSLNLASFFMALVALITVVFNHQIVTLIFSEKYAASGLTFSLLMISLHMTVLVTLMGYTMISVGFPTRSLGANTVRESLMFIANLIFIPIVGYVAPAYTKIMAFYVANPLSVWLLKRSNFPITATPMIKQTVLLWIGSALIWLFHPESIFIQIIIIAAFIILNILLSTVSLDDLSLMLPEFLKRRFGMPTEVLPDSQ